MHRGISGKESDAFVFWSWSRTKKIIKKKLPNNQGISHNFEAGKAKVNLQKLLGILCNNIFRSRSLLIFWKWIMSLLQTCWEAPKVLIWWNSNACLLVQKSHFNKSERASDIFWNCILILPDHQDKIRHWRWDRV